ncbi:hypothetical protein [Shimia sp.]|uniref:hypothetical protein n=1 Tax=Shimia sp. TaxID=1954381 RepID=UPI003B8CB290
MGHKNDRQDTRDELSRLLKGLEFFRLWRIEGVRAANGQVTQEDLNQIVMPSAFFWDVSEQASEKIALKEVKSWYGHAASDLRYWATSGNPELAESVARFVDAFRSEMGFDFFEEAGILKKLAKKALKQGRIANEEDYYVLKELETNLSQSDLKPQEMSALSDLLRDFEDTQV